MSACYCKFCGGEQCRFCARQAEMSYADRVALAANMRQHANAFFHAKSTEKYLVDGARCIEQLLDKVGDLENQIDEMRSVSQDE